MLSVSLFSTTVGTVGRFSVTAARIMSFLYLLLQNQSESVIPATPCSCNDAPPTPLEGVPHCCFKQSDIRLVNTPPTPPPILQPYTKLILTGFAAKNGPCVWIFSAFDLPSLQLGKKSLTDKMRVICIILTFVWHHYIFSWSSTK